MILIAIFFYAANNTRTKKISLEEDVSKWSKTA